MRNIDEELLYACWNGDLEGVEQLLEEGADVNAKDKDGWTALMIASKNGHKEVVELLIERGADVNAEDKNGWTALMIACWNNHEEIVELLKFYEARRMRVIRFLRNVIRFFRDVIYSLLGCLLYFLPFWITLIIIIKSCKK